MLVGTPGEEASTLIFQSPGAGAPAEGAATLRHLPWAVIRGRVLPGTRTALVVADTARRGDGSFGATLLRISPGAAPEVLADRVFHATRPLVTSTGRVFVERGIEGPARVDRLSIDEVNPMTGEARPVHAFEGYTTHLVGALGDELLVYRVRYQHADLVAVHMDTGTTRKLRGELVPFARDFSVDEVTRVLRWTTLETATGDWVVVAMNADEGVETVIARAQRPSLAASAWPGGRWAFNPGGDRGLALSEGEDQRRIAPLGPGADVVRAATGNGAWVALDHTRPSSLPAPFVMSQDGKRVLRIAVPEGMRSEILGFVEVR